MADEPLVASVDQSFGFEVLDGLLDGASAVAGEGAEAFLRWVGSIASGVGVVGEDEQDPEGGSPQFLLRDVVERP